MTTLKLPPSAGESPSPADGETVTAERDKREHDREHKREDKDEKYAQNPDGSVAGSYSSPERHNGAIKVLVESHDVDAALEAEPASPAEAAHRVNTDDKGHSRTRGEDGQTPRRRGRYLRRRR